MSSFILRENFWGKQFLNYHKFQYFPRVRLQSDNYFILRENLWGKQFLNYHVFLHFPTVQLQSINSFVLRKNLWGKKFLNYIFVKEGSELLAQSDAGKSLLTWIAIVGWNSKDQEAYSKILLCYGAAWISTEENVQKCRCVSFPVITEQLWISLNFSDFVRLNIFRGTFPGFLNFSHLADIIV